MSKRAMILVLILAGVVGRAHGVSQKTLKEVYEDAKKSVVLLITFDERGEAQSLGSGVILTPDGEIVTNLHVVRQARTVSAKMWNGSFLSIDGVAGSDQKSDLVILKADAQDLPSARMVPRTSVAVGDSVIAIGNPLGLESTLSTGVVSGFREMPALGRVIQITAPISPGSSGGGLFARDGSLVAITTSTLLEGQSVNFAVPVERVNRVERFSKAVKFSELSKRIEGSGGQLGSREQPTGNGQESLNAAKKYLQLEMLDDAEKALSAALAADKFDPEVHFYLGEFYTKRRSFQKAREEYKIALNLDPQALTPLVRLAASNLAIYSENHQNEFRGEAVTELRGVVQRGLVVKSDRYADESTLSAITAKTDDYLKELLRITGEWVTKEGVVWKFVETDGPQGKLVAPNTGVVYGNISVTQAGGSSTPTLGFMWRNGELTLEGYYFRRYGECGYRRDISLHESEDGNQLTGTMTYAPRDKKRRDCPELQAGGVAQIVLFRQ